MSFIHICLNGFFFLQEGVLFSSDQTMLSWKVKYTETNLFLKTVKKFIFWVW